ncbi:MAG: gamma-glutamylcyclotransferase family protein [Planctomycetaceae bacterium]
MSLINGCENFTETVFVYGSLKRGYSLSGLLSGQQFVREALTAPDFRLYDLGRYPGLIRFPGRGLSIHGELYRVTPECLRRLDDVEGVDEGLYARERIDLLTGDLLTPAWAYIFLGDTLECSDCGCRWPASVTDG